uniref:PAP-associated domain-containing protein n=1 Tax=Parascaris univalens TaxID=6257 RepID=A0A915CDE6_PARUN
MLNLRILRRFRLLYRLNFNKKLHITQQRIGSSKSAKSKSSGNDTSTSRPSFEEINSRYAQKIVRLGELLNEAQQNYRNNNAKRLLEMRDLVSRIEKKACSANSRLVPIGSLSNSFVFDSSSDVDVCFFPLLARELRAEFNADFHQNLSFRERFMRIMFERIVGDEEIGGNDLNMDECMVLYRARVPILVIKYKNGLSVDVQFPSDSYQAMRNTNLVRHYAMADRRFGLVYMWLRTLFRSLGIMRSKEGLFSSYHILCLVAHFLQCTSGALSKTVLPVLIRSHAHLVGPDVDIDKVVEMLGQPVEGRTLQGWCSENRMNAGELAVRLIDYYANMDIFRCAISLDKGTLERKKQPSSENWLQIFDPYSKANVCKRRDAGDAFQHAINFVFHKMQDAQRVMNR